ncbi:MAG: 3-deoxy-7-phosphoheptulonate synthase, partial [Planctomycetota bacterium]
MAAVFGVERLAAVRLVGLRFVAVRFAERVAGFLAVERLAVVVVFRVAVVRLALVAVVLRPAVEALRAVGRVVFFAAGLAAGLRAVVRLVAVRVAAVRVAGFLAAVRFAVVFVADFFAGLRLVAVLVAGLVVFFAAERLAAGFVVFFAAGLVVLFAVVLVAVVRLAVGLRPLARAVVRLPAALRVVRFVVDRRVVEAMTCSWCADTTRSGQRGPGSLMLVPGGLMPRPLAHASHPAMPHLSSRPARGLAFFGHAHKIDTEVADKRASLAHYSPPATQQSAHRDSRSVPKDPPVTTPLHPADWSPTSWKTKLDPQQVLYTDRDAVERATAKLASLPPLVTSWEIDSLRDKIAAAQRGESFLLQGGD